MERIPLGNWSTAASDSITLNAVPPSGTVLINGGAAWTRTTAASLTFPNTAADVIQVRVGTTLANVPFQAYTARDDAAVHPACR